MVLDDAISYDTLGDEQSTGFKFDLESGSKVNPGWFSEGSVQRILYDLYDSNDDTDGNDTLSLGFTPIHNVLRGAQQEVEAFTSIFTFITALKSENPANADDIDDIVASESIASITDILGTGRTNQSSDYPYVSISIGATTAITTTNTYGSYNKLNNRKYLLFTVSSADSCTLSVTQTNGSTSDPEIYLYKTTEGLINSVETSTAGSESLTQNLSVGDYIFEVYDYEDLSDITFNVSVTQN